MNDELFDKKIKEKLKLENNIIPNYINNAFDNGIKKGKINKRKRYKNIAGLASACLVGTLILGITLPTYAVDLPILRNIVDYFSDSRYKNYDKYASDLNISKESEGIKVTINKVIYDGLDLEVFYTIEGKKVEGNIPSFFEVKTKVNGKEVSFGNSSTREVLEDFSIGNISYGVSQRDMVPKELQNESFYGGYSEIPDEFIFSLEIGAISIGDNIINGSWDFDIQVTNELVKGKVNEYNLNESLSYIKENGNINKLLTTPINTALQGTYYGEELMEVEFLAFDDKGRYIAPKSENSFGTRTNEGIFINYFNNQFEEVYEDSENLTFIPYQYKSSYHGVKTVTSGTEKDINGNEVIVRDTSSNKSNEPFRLKKDLNLNGETKLKTIMDEEYGVITRVEVKDGKSKLYVKSNYNIFAVPVLIRDKDSGEELTPIDNFEKMNIKTSKYLSETGEILVEYDGIIDGENYEIEYYDFTHEINIYSDNTFNIDLNK